MPRDLRELIRIKKPVEPLDASAVVKRTNKAVLIEKVVGFGMPLALSMADPAARGGLRP
jgi:3-polyprenyl-4-hydroxybenzoate decarboxylase